jgi:hypothetical protein
MLYRLVCLLDKCTPLRDTIFNGTINRPQSPFFNEEVMSTMCSSFRSAAASLLVTR